MIIMLDTNIYGRAFDNFQQKRILNEAISAKQIFSWSIEKKLIIKSSDVLFAELELIKDQTKRELTISLVKEICDVRVHLNNSIIALTDDIYRTLKDYMDALHVAFAAFTKSSYFITCDEEIIKKRETIESYLKSKGYQLIITNPIEFVEVMKT
jgi:predicted nucleic acid-binding protein